jgi:hypothetical protein
MATEAMGKTTQSTSTDEPFDPKSFLVVPARTFEKSSIGDIFRAPSRTLTDALRGFQTVSADNHPVRYDAEWGRKYGHSAPDFKFWLLQHLAPRYFHTLSGSVHRLRRTHMQVSQRSALGRHALPDPQDCWTGTGGYYGNDSDGHRA